MGQLSSKLRIIKEAFTTGGMLFFPPASIILCLFLEHAQKLKMTFLLLQRWKNFLESGWEISEHFRAYFRFSWPSHSSLGIIRKGLFLLPTLSLSDASNGQRWWRQKWNKGQRSLWPVTVESGVNGLRNTKRPKWHDPSCIFFLSGDKFDIKDYHHVFLSAGPMGLDTLEEAVDEYIDSMLAQWT